MNVLLVEDDRDLAELLCELLRINQYNVLAASSLREARAVLPTFDPVLVILDRGLPDGDGLSLLPALTTRLVIVLTASPPEYVVQSLDQGADDFLLKPFVPSELLARIRALVRRKQSAGESVTAFGNVRLGERPFINGRARCGAPATARIRHALRAHRAAPACGQARLDAGEAYGRCRLFAHKHLRARIALTQGAVRCGSLVDDPIDSGRRLSSGRREAMSAATNCPFRW
ncbi:MAG: response regulator transcription factor [Gemmatimonas sp.]|nr:response regulator transcription factor [Gemmatimonas sp.]